MSGPLVTMDSIRLTRKGRTVLRDLSLAVDAGEWVTVLGGQAAGTEELAMVLAGFTAPDRGRIRLGGEDIARLPPHRRGLGVVHRELGLFADMDVAGNLAATGAARTDIATVRELFRLDDLVALLPHLLSPSEAVRVAIARALARRPALLLLDDPWRGLDLAGIESVLAMLIAARAQTGVAVLHVTTRPDLAWSVAEPLVAMIDGSLRQEGTAVSLYDAPIDLDVARLLGPCNALAGRVLRRDDDLAVVQLDFGAVVEARASEHLGSGRCVVAVRPERLAMTTASVAELGEGAFGARIDAIQFRGDSIRVGLSAALSSAFPGAARAQIVASRPAAVPLLGARVGSGVAVAWQPHQAWAFADQTLSAALASPDAGGPPRAAVSAVAPVGAGGYLAPAREDLRASS